MKNRNKLHVVFGAGGLGQAVARELTIQGKQVRAVNRHGKADVPASVKMVKADGMDKQSTLTACKDAGVIYFCANADYTQWPTLFPPMVDNIIHTASQVGAKLVYADNLYMYGSVEGPIHEDLPWDAQTVKGKLRADMAAKILDAHNSGKLSAAIARASDFYGPGVLNAGLAERVFGAALMDKAADVIGNPDMPHTFTYIRDFARALIILGEHEEALGEVWHVPSAPTVTIRHMLEMIYHETGFPTRFRTAGKTMVGLISLFNPMMREIKEMMYQFERPFIVDHSKFVHMFGDISTAHRVAIRETLAWFHQQERLKLRQAA